MLFAWIDKNGTLCSTYDEQYVPTEYKEAVVVFEDLDIHDADKIVNDNGIIRRKTTDEELAEIKKVKKVEITQARFEAETGGIHIDGVKIKTDRESQSLFMGAALFAKEDPTYTVNWKGENGWVVLDAQTILYLASQVRAHVQSCFDKEKALHDMIDAATTVEEVESITWDSIP